MKTKLKIVCTFILIVIIFWGIYTVISINSIPDYKKKHGLEIGQSGTIGDWELTLTNIQYYPNTDTNKTNVVINVNVKYNGVEETTYPTNYLLWQKDESKSPYKNIEWSNDIEGKYVFNSNENQKTLNATFEIDKSIIEDDDMWFMIVLGTNVKYIIKK